MRRAGSCYELSVGQSENFHDRGLAVPFTTPSLRAGRVRATAWMASCAADRRFGQPDLVLLLPNPSGGRGAYVLPWADLRQSHSPTVHDVQVCLRLGSFVQNNPVVTPADIRRIGRCVAVEGFAGRMAAEAATEAATRDARAHAAAAAFFRQMTDGSGVQDVAGPREATIQGLATLFADFGIGQLAEEARIPRLIRSVAELARDMAAAAEGRDGTLREAMSTLLVAADLTAALAARALAAARAKLQIAATLQGDRLPNPVEIARMTGRADLLLDGWDRVCALWQGASATGSASALRDAACVASVVHDMASILPVLPGETDVWFALPPGTAAQVAPRRAGARAPLPAEQTLVDLIARNERLLVLAA